MLCALAEKTTGRPGWGSAGQRPSCGVLWSSKEGRGTWPSTPNTHGAGGGCWGRAPGSRGGCQSQACAAPGGLGSAEANGDNDAGGRLTAAAGERSRLRRRRRLTHLVTLASSGLVRRSCASSLGRARRALGEGLRGRWARHALCALVGRRQAREGKGGAGGNRCLQPGKAPGVRLRRVNRRTVTLVRC